jgi:hypothetical protein
LFSINHVFSNLTGRRAKEDFRWFSDYFPAVETRNAGIAGAANRQAVRFAARTKKIAIGGSDAHTLESAGVAFTEVSGARNKDEFFQGLHHGAARVRGEAGSFTRLTTDVVRVAQEMMREERWTRILAPLALLIPVVVLSHCVAEQFFAQRWARRVIPAPQSRDRWTLITAPGDTAKEPA